MNFGPKCIGPVGGHSHGDLLTCVKCANYVIKYGKSTQNKQRYYCKHCKSTHVESYSYVAQQPEINPGIISLTKEGCGIRSTARLLQISAATVISRIRKIASKLVQPPISIGKTYEMDASAVPSTTNPGSFATLSASNCNGIVSWGSGYENNARIYVSPSSTISSTPRCFKSVKTDNQNLAPSFSDK